MEKETKQYLEKFDDETAGQIKEYVEAKVLKLDELGKTQEEVIKMKESFEAMGIDFDKATPEDAKIIKAIKAGGDAEISEDKEMRLKALGGMMGAFASGKGSIQVAKEQVNGWEAMARTPEQKEFVKNVKKAVETTTFQGGGAVVPMVYSNDFIIALRDQSFLSQLGIRRVNFTGGQYVIGKHNVGVTGAYVGETKKVNKDQPKFGDVILTPKKAGVIVPISNEWLRNSDTGAFQNVTQDAINAMEELQGSTFLEGSGTQYTPKGLTKLVNASNTTTSAGTSVANIITDLLYGRKQLTAGKIAIRKPATIINPAQETHLMGLRDSDGWVFKDEMMLGKLFGMPYFGTTAATNTKIYFADFDKIYEASNRSLEMAQSDSATYTDANGNSVNAFEQDMSLMRLIYAHDYGTQYDTAITIITSVSWGN